MNPSDPTVPKSIDLKNCQPHEYVTLIRERQLDSFGHVNNAQYMVLFEEARWEAITSRGFGLNEIQSGTVGTVVLECSIRFLHELKLRETITIKTEAIALMSKVATVRQTIVKESGEIAAQAEFKMGCFDLKLRKLVSPTPIWLKALTGTDSPV